MTTKDLEEAVAKMRALPADQQAYAAEIIDVLAAQEDDIPLSFAEIAGVEEALAQADRGEFASNTEVAETFKHFRT
jgi:predicted transcriptional regulator